MKNLCSVINLRIHNDTILVSKYGESLVNCFSDTTTNQRYYNIVSRTILKNCHLRRRSGNFVNNHNFYGF